MSRFTRRAIAALVAISLCTLAAPTPATAGGKGGGGKKPPVTVGTPDGRFSCRAALARLEGAGILSGVHAEVNAANPAGDPCATDFAGIQLNALATLGTHWGTSTVLLGADLKVLYGGTQLLKDAGYQVPRKAVAEAGVALLRLQVLGNAVEVAVLTSNAKARCRTDNTPYLSGSSQVVGLKVNGVLKDDDFGVRISLGEHMHVTLQATLLASLDVIATFKHLYTEAELDLLLKAGVTLHLNHQSVAVAADGAKLTQRALWLESNLLGNVIVSESVADFHGNPCTTTTGPPPPPPPPSASKGWMTGGGRINAASGKVTHGLRLECTPANGPNNIQVNWDGGGFHATGGFTAKCDNGADGVNSSGNPNAAFDTLTGSAAGRCQGGGEGTAYYTVTDKGEPGTADTLRIRVVGCGLSDTGTLALERGKHQAHGRP